MNGKYSMVKVERLPEDEPANYRVHCLPEGADFRNEESYETLEACWLKLNGVGFGTQGSEFGEKGEKVGVIQDVEGGSLELKVPA